MSQVESYSTEEATCGFLAGDHLFDGNFGLEKNVIGDALHCAVRIDTNRIPSALRKAWLQIELAAFTADSPSGRPTKAQRQEAKEAVEARCQEEAQSGKFRSMQQFPVLWDGRNNGPVLRRHQSHGRRLTCDLFEPGLRVGLGAAHRRPAGRGVGGRGPATQGAGELDAFGLPSRRARADIAWWSSESGNFDFLGNEFLLWLWWRWETQSETIALPDGSEVTGMFSRTLSLQCPRGESGKETITAEAPARLPEAMQAIRSGKLPRKAGLTLVRHGDQYELVLQAETFTVSGAKIRTEETAQRRRRAGHRRAAHRRRPRAARDGRPSVPCLLRATAGERVARRTGKDPPLAEGGRRPPPDGSRREARLRAEARWHRWRRSPWAAEGVRKNGPGAAADNQQITVAHPLPIHSHWPKITGVLASLWLVEPTRGWNRQRRRRRLMLRAEWAASCKTYPAIPRKGG